MRKHPLLKEMSQLKKIFFLYEQTSKQLEEGKYRVAKTA